MADISKTFVHLARLALEGNRDDAAALVRKTARSLGETNPGMAEALRGLLRSHHPGRPLRSAATLPPVDNDTRMDLLRIEHHPTLDFSPIWPESVRSHLEAVISEHERAEELARANVSPTRSLLFVGPPGVGKTVASRWIAERLARPLLVLDLATVMSSFLGRTGNNIRAALEYARSTPSVLLLDEFDAIAKRRDDQVEVGELKRLVTVILQALDDWPVNGLLIAATNHPELLDRAVWRRFDSVLNFPMPGPEELELALSQWIDFSVAESDPTQLSYAAALNGMSFSDASRLVSAARRKAVLRQQPIQAVLAEELRQRFSEMPRKERLKLALQLVKSGKSEREASKITGVARQTLLVHRDSNGTGKLGE